MTLTYTLLPVLILFFAGCFKTPNLQNHPQKQIGSSNVPVSQNFNIKKPFFIDGGIFSISGDGNIYFVASEDKSVVRKARLDTPEEFSEFIDLKEWLKSDTFQNFEIDDLWSDHQGRLVVAESTSGKILRISKDARKLENLADSYDGYRFTKIKGLAGNQMDQIFIGTPNAATIYGFDPTDGKLEVLNEELVRPNDFSMNTKGDRLLVSESKPNRVVVVEMNGTDSGFYSWELIRFPRSQDEPLSLDLLDDQSNLLAVLIGNGQSLLLFDLEDGRIKARLSLPVRCYRVRHDQGWFYLQTDEGIIRVINTSG